MLPGQTNYFHSVSELQQEQQQQQATVLCHTTNGSSSSNSTLTAFSSRLLADLCLCLFRYWRRC